MIKYVDGDFFNFDADIRINTVNCVGVMGAGVALAFKNKYPEMYKEYKKACINGEIRPGKPQVWFDGDLFSKGVTIINFPTKDHWRKPSEYEYIEQGLIWLRDYLKQYSNDFTITVPALGCGHGGLDWNIVKELIKKYLGELQINVLVFEPKSSVDAPNSEAYNLEEAQRLSSLGIRKVSPVDDDFPERLRLWSDRKVYVSGKITSNQSYDVTIIASTSPEESEKKLVLNFVNQIINNHKSVILGSSKFENELINILLEEKVKVGISLPSGIVEKCERDIAKSRDKVTIFSLGSPFENFDKKNFISSTLIRLHLSDVVIITTPSLDWILKYKKNFFRDNKVFFVKRNNCDLDLCQKLESLGAVPINGEFRIW